MKKPFIYPRCLIILDREFEERYRPATCGYGIYVKNKKITKYDNTYEQSDIGWTCKHPAIETNARFDRGYYPNCSYNCPVMKEDFKIIKDLLYVGSQG